MIKQPKLVDAHAMSVLYKTFEIPSKTQIQKLQPGDFCQVNSNGERFWCRLIFKYKDDCIGIVDNELLNLTDVKIGDLINFNLVNIYKILPDEKREKLPKFLIITNDNTIMILHAHKPKFIGKLIAENPLKMKDVFIIDEPENYENEMPKILKDMADWFFYKFVNK